MPRHAKGPRLYLRQGRIDARTKRRLPDIYFIRDGANQRSTGCGPDRLADAERALARYIAEKWQPARTAAAAGGDEADRRPRDPADVLIAEVLALYAKERAPELGAPKDTAARVGILLEWWGDKLLSDVRRSVCKAYVAWRTDQVIRAFSADAEQPRKVTDQAARRELEDLSAAIGYWDAEYPLTARPKVWMPEKRQGSRDALTRSQAAALLWAALGWRKGVDGRWTRLRGSSGANRAHIRRFILVGLYTGTRPGVIPKLLWEESATQAWVDLDAGIIYRRGRREADKATKRRPLVKLPPRLLVHMRRWKALDDAAMEARAKALKPTANTFLHHGGQPILGRIRKGFAGAVADAGLPAEITPHWMRHTCATWLMQGGADVWEAAGYTGMTTKTLESHYGHHRPDHQAAARRALR